MMVELQASLSPVGSESQSTLQATPYETTVADERPVAIRSISLPAPTETMPNPNGRSLSASDASRGPYRPSSARASPKSSNQALSPNPEGSTRRSMDERFSRKTPSLRSVPSIVVNDPNDRPVSRPGSRPGSRWSERKWGGLKKRSSDLEEKMSREELPPVPQIDSAFSGISMDIPTSSLEGLDKPMKFSNRGSLIRDKRPILKARDQQQERRSQQIPEDQTFDFQSDTASIQQSIPADSAPTSKAPSIVASSTGQDAVTDDIPEAKPRPFKPEGHLNPRKTSLQSRAISADEDMLSRRVRLMYEKGDDSVTDKDVANAIASEHGVLWEEPTPDLETASTPGTNLGSPPSSIARASAEVERKRMKRETQELAGGVEYWQDIGAGQRNPHPIQRVTTSLLLASETPRRKLSIRPPTARASTRSFNGRSPTRNLSQSSTAARPTSSASAHAAPIRRSTSRLRSATNHLPHNRDRKFTDEASYMLTLPADDPGEGKDTPAARAVRKKEWQREDKWTKMAKQTKKSRDGGGMRFEFDTHSPKLIERTWKGIPDRWRASAWSSFLEASAKRHKDSPSEEALVEAFHESQYVSSPDDVQIDIDVPRTISSHIMFRRRYRGGQRLLFRVLHAMSLYYPDTGYVQGMAAIAATLLAYYDEEHAFVMLARLWRLRGLEELYKSGFAGLMEALDDFEREWLAGGEVATQLTEVGIPPTAYGTRWYLTLFNYSIPFPAQLRVWDVFMLLGDAEEPVAPRPTTSSGKGPKAPPPRLGTFGQGLDVLHATSAALIDGMRDIILESDFENTMKVLTSWIPIKDVEIFMRVAKAEYKVHRRKKTH
ncbi:hypothetical protein N7454_009917 [Penicillium verhagenii]|nr:hypothetical protein N7454_009917 [Penicillium verhagenii]